jgi:hypothetical protein
MPIALGREALLQLVEALGLRGQNVRRLVLDVPADGVVVVYVERYGDAAQIAAVADVLATRRGEEDVEAREGPVIGDMTAGLIIVGDP